MADQRLVIAGLNAQLKEAEAAANQFFQENQALRAQVGRLKEMNIFINLVCAVESANTPLSAMSADSVISRADALMNATNRYFREKLEDMQAKAAAAEGPQTEGPQTDGDAKTVGQEPPAGQIITPGFRKPTDDSPGADQEGAD